MDTETRNRLKANQYFLVEELERRDISVSVLDLENELLEARLGLHREFLLDIDSSLMSYAASVTASEKPLAKAIMERAGIRVPRGTVLKAHEKEKAAVTAEKLGFPVVVKPPFGSQGDNVYAPVEYASELESIFERVFSSEGSARLMVEEYFAGREYRIFITRRGDFAALWRDPAHVTGNGTQSIAILIEQENYRRTHPRINCLCPILIDTVSTDFLRKQGRSLDSTPEEGLKIYLRGNSNVKCGAMAEDVTDLVHPSVLNICLKALEAFPGLPYAGIDFMCEDISRPRGGSDYRIIEINSLPGIGMHINPGRGCSRNVAAMIVDMIFPESVRLRAAA